MNVLETQIDSKMKELEQALIGGIRNSVYYYDQKTFSDRTNWMDFFKKKRSRFNELYTKLESPTEIFIQIQQVLNNFGKISNENVSDLFEELRKLDYDRTL